VLTFSVNPRLERGPRTKWRTRQKGVHQNNKMLLFYIWDRQCSDLKNHVPRTTIRGTSHPGLPMFLVPNSLADRGVSAPSGWSRMGSLPNRPAEIVDLTRVVRNIPSPTPLLPFCLRAYIFISSTSSFIFRCNVIQLNYYLASSSYTWRSWKTR
jgi:hypothetical protein